MRQAFTIVVAMQAADAQIKAGLLAEMTDARVAATAHPASGPRPDFDDMLNVLEQVVVPLGQQPCPWRGEQMESTTAPVRQGAFTVLANGDATGLSAEFSFQNRTSLLTVGTETLNPQLWEWRTVGASSADEHRRGRRCSLLRRTDSARELESLTRTHFLGAWCWRDDGISFVNFLPNAVHSGGADLFNVLVAMNGRAKWVTESSYGDDWAANRDGDERPLATPSAAEFLEP